ncbi:hypothetical protein HDK90DRAFT_187040 [Phyllosticta capitalensis]|uniref:Uncharacterized protein n=1 Tax=Phyllosticta capitalensis TaxID=121624 RepID=A0ABR1YWD9_9PEZI
MVGAVGGRHYGRTVQSLLDSLDCPLIGRACFYFSTILRVLFSTDQPACYLPVQCGSRSRARFRLGSRLLCLLGFVGELFFVALFPFFPFQLFLRRLAFCTILLIVGILLDRSDWQ